MGSGNMVGKRVPAKRLKSIGFLAAAASLLAACGGSEYRYVSNSTENLFFKVPKHWTQYKLTDTDKDGRAESLPSGLDRVWHYGYDASDAPSQAHLDEVAPEKPVAQAVVWKLLDSSNDRMSLSRARSIAFNMEADPLLQDPGAPAAWELVPIGGVPDVRLTFPKGVTGTRVAINVPSPKDPKVFRTVDATTLIDPSNQRLYILVVSCSAQCYLDNRQVIDTVAQSWTVNRS
jgi:hypothetical protein